MSYETPQEKADKKEVLATLTRIEATLNAILAIMQAQERIR